MLLKLQHVSALKVPLSWSRNSYTHAYV